MAKASHKVTAKLNNNVRKALAIATIEADTLSVFDHFSYQADWSNFPNSLMVNCHLQHNLAPSESALLQEKLRKLLQLSLLKQGIKFRDFRKNITLNYDSETLP
ncbi:MAG: hypothetical protein ACJASB_003855 [Shewanella psychromarinicola]|jgi:hypothetical protein|uniref:hypothetical protein n=1 Tax=Shewanella psychromarinicola TaxID=2487742 RepID=UPI003EEF14FE